MYFLPDTSLDTKNGLPIFSSGINTFMPEEILSVQYKNI